MEWERDTRYEGYYYFKKETFNDFVYYLEAYVEYTFKKETYWFALSSGKKRKELDIYIEKERKSKGGLQALIWAKKEILDFPEFIGNPFRKSRYIAIRWADNRRRDIYARTLLKEGFQFQIIEREKVLIKKI